MNVLRLVAHVDWGADTETMLKLYRCQIRSKLDYGSIMYGSARDSYLFPHQRVQNAPLRLFLGTFKSPVTKLNVEANEPPADWMPRCTSS